MRSAPPMISTCSPPATDYEGAGAQTFLCTSLSFRFPSSHPGLSRSSLQACGPGGDASRGGGAPALTLDFGLGDADRRLVSAAVSPISHLSQLLGTPSALGRPPLALLRLRAQWLSTCFERIFSNLQTLPRHFLRLVTGVDFRPHWALHKRRSTRTVPLFSGTYVQCVYTR